MDGGHRGDAANSIGFLKKGLKMSSLVLMMADAIAETVALRGREYLSDAETNLLEFKPEFKQIGEDHLNPIARSNGVTHPRRVELSGD